MDTNLPLSGQVSVLGPDTLQGFLSIYMVGRVQSVCSLCLHICPKNLFWGVGVDWFWGCVRGGEMPSLFWELESSGRTDCDRVSNVFWFTHPLRATRAVNCV